MEPPAARRRVRIPFTPFVPLLMVIVIVVSGGLVAAMLLPIAHVAGQGIDRVNTRLEFLGECHKVKSFPQTSTIYASDGKTELAKLYLDYNRELVHLDQISPIAQKAVLSIEDHNFYQHGALNFTSLIRALIANAASGTIVQGGSTLTQQLVKQITGATEQTFQRKFQEAAIAICLEQKYTKDQLLELYLNEIPLGNGVYGIGTAADYYFHVPAAKLSISQAAMLAGMIQAPGDFDPLKHPKRTLARRNEVLQALATYMGVPQDRVDKAKAEPLGVAKDVGQTLQQHPPFIVDYVRSQLLDLSNHEYDALGTTTRARTHSIFQGGLRIYTTLDPDWQRYAQAAVDARWYDAPAPGHHSETPDVGIVSIDNATGAIRTMLSGRDYQRDQINLVTSGRQPGSSFKPYTLTAAFEQKVPPGTQFSSKSPLHVSGWGNACSCVSNAEGAGDQGYLNLWQATADSINVVFVQLELSLKHGPADVVAAAHQVGITSPLTAVNSLTLGTEEVTPLEQASAFQTFANGGKHCEPYAVSKIVGPDGVLYKHTTKCEQVIKPDVANLVTAMLLGVVQHGTGTHATLVGHTVAGKTGTTQDYSNAWFVGYTRQVSTAVWVGFPFSTHSMEPYFGGPVFGGTIAAPIWHTYMTRVMSGMPNQGFPQPPPPARGPIPRVVGLRSNAAEAKIHDAHFSVKVEKVASVQPKGTVINQSPNPGTTAELGSVVTIQVSTGAAPQVVVPDVVGHTQQFAELKLTNAGLVVKVLHKVVSVPSKVGKVLAQKPAGGVKADKGSKVTITVGVSSA